jgi:hypothetical protein
MDLFLSGLATIIQYVRRGTAPSAQPRSVLDRRDAQRQDREGTTNNTSSSENSKDDDFMSYFKEFIRQGGLDHIFPSEDDRDTSVQFELVSTVCFLIVERGRFASCLVGAADEKLYLTSLCCCVRLGGIIDCCWQASCSDGAQYSC